MTHDSFAKIIAFSGKAANGLRYLRVGGRGLCLGAGKTRSQKMLVNRADSHTSGARFVRRFYVVQDARPEKRHYHKLENNFTSYLIFSNEQKIFTTNWLT